jgi:hypothetical protein
MKLSKDYIDKSMEVFVSLAIMTASALRHRLAYSLPGSAPDPAWVRGICCGVA